MIKSENQRCNFCYPPVRLGSSGRAPHAAQPAAAAAQPAAVRALQEGAARRPQPPAPPTHHQRHGAGGAEQRNGKFQLFTTSYPLSKKQAVAKLT